MQHLFTAVFLFAATQVHAAWDQVSDAATFNQQVVGNAYADARGNWFRFNADGTLSGGAAGKSLTGAWTFQRGFACFNRALGGEALPNDCIVVMVDGNSLVTVRDQGRGKQTQYTRQ